MYFSRRVLIAVVVVTVLTLTGCGSHRSEAQGGLRDGAQDRVVKIGMILPLSGGVSTAGIGVRNAAELAVRRANDQNKIPGWRVVLDPQDDQGIPDVGANAAAKLSDDPSVLAVVGTLHSSVAEHVAPILNDRRIVMVSPGNSNPSLTHGGDPSGKIRPFRFYFRVVTTDTFQGPFAADFVYHTLSRRNVVVVHDKKVYGRGLALAFKERFENTGGTILSVETIEPDDQDFSAVLAKIKRLKPDLIYYGGEYPAGSLLTSQADQQGLPVPVMGGDGNFAATYLRVAGEAAEGDLATAHGAPPDQLPAAEAFLAAYEAAGYRDPPEAYGPYGYDAAKVVIEALAQVLPGRDRIDDTVREQLRQAVQEIRVDGMTGTVAFDEYGDTTTRILTVYRVENGAWKAVKTAEFHPQHDPQ